MLELVQGETLKDRVDRLGPMPATDCLPIFIQLCDAMHYAHGHGIVHRDLKPANIMLVEEQEKLNCKILDFGIAQMESEAQKLTLAGEIWGSPHYMSPEQCTAEPVDHLTDIYSLGILMYYTLSGVLPHKGSDFAEVVNQKLFQPVPEFAILQLAKPISVPLGLERIVFRCMRRKKTERFQTMEELKLALEGFAKRSRGEVRDTRPSMVAYSGAGKEVGKPGQSKDKKLPRLMLAAMAIISLLLVVAVALLVGQAVMQHR